MRNANKIFDWRLTGILLILWGFNLFQVVSLGIVAGGAGAQAVSILSPSVLGPVFAAPRYCLVVLLAIWCAMAGSPRPWRLVIVSLVSLHMIFLAILAAIYWGHYSYRSMWFAGELIGLFVLMLFATFILLVMRLWGWNIEQTQNCGARGVTTRSGTAGGAGPAVQFSLTDLLLWTAGLAVLLSVLSTLIANSTLLVRYDRDVIVVVLVGLGLILLMPFVVRIALGKTRWLVGIVILGVLFVGLAITFAFIPFPTHYHWSRHFVSTIVRQASLVTVASSVWTLLQLLLVRAAGYRFSRVRRKEAATILCASAPPRDDPSGSEAQ